MSFLTSIVTSALICRICHVATQTKLSKLLLLLKGIIDPILLGVKEEEEALKRRRRGSHMRVMWMRVRHVLQGLSKESVAWHDWSVGVQLTFRSICHSAYRLCCWFTPKMDRRRVVRRNSLQQNRTEWSRRRWAGNEAPACCAKTHV